MRRTEISWIPTRQKLQTGSSITYCSTKAITKFSCIRPHTSLRWGISYWSRTIMYKALYACRMDHPSQIQALELAPERPTQSALYKIQRLPNDLNGSAPGPNWSNAKGPEGAQPHGRMDVEPIPECRELEDVEHLDLSQWQKRWTGSSKGRHTHHLWPEIRPRLASKFVHVDHYMSQFAIGHGNFAAKHEFLSGNICQLDQNGMFSPFRDAVSDHPFRTLDLSRSSDQVTHATVLCASVSYNNPFKTVLQS